MGENSVPSRNWIDDTEELERITKNIIKKYTHFILLKHLRILFSWHEPYRWSDENRPIMAQVRKLNNKDRDIFQYDIEIEVNAELWNSAKKGERKRIMFHELSHIDIEHDSNFKLETDNVGRIKVNILPHDLVIHTFRDEIETFGISKVDIPPAKVLSRSMQRVKRLREAKKGELR